MSSDMFYVGARVVVCGRQWSGTTLDSLLGRVVACDPFRWYKITLDVDMSHIWLYENEIRTLTPLEELALCAEKCE